ncbi:MAG: HdeD family acid-resistance protein [Alphaproteobacteria bacterium]|nr:HdeD family acid-resistance protein [Rhodospirillales bacterium]MBN9562769.1 HdeD family acid-resistance protein [Alphaproteobacteria bacterium]
MSITTSNLSPSGPAGARHRWGWFVVLGVLLIAIGIFAWIEVVTATIAGVIVLGAALLVGGIFQIIHAFAVRAWSGFFLHVLMGIVYVIGGLLLMNDPLPGAIVVTLFVAICLVVAGIFRMVLAVRHRELTGWWLMLFSGLITLLIGLLIYASLPWSSLWVIGTLIAVELVIHGITWIQFGLMLRRMPQVGATA